MTPTSQLKVNSTTEFFKKSFHINIDSFYNILQTEKQIWGVKDLPLASRIVVYEVECPKGFFLTQKVKKYKLKSSNGFIYDWKTRQLAIEEPIPL